MVLPRLRLLNACVEGLSPALLRSAAPKRGFGGAVPVPSPACVARRPRGVRGSCRPAVRQAIQSAATGPFTTLAQRVPPATRAGASCVPPDSARSASFAKGFLLQFLNAKIFIFGITALTCFITPHHQTLGIILAAEYFIATLGTVATLTWIGFGLIIQRFYLRHFRIINILMALTLLECVWSMLTS